MSASAVGNDPMSVVGRRLDPSRKRPLVQVTRYGRKLRGQPNIPCAAVLQAIQQTTINQKLVEWLRKSGRGLWQQRRFFR